MFVNKYVKRTRPYPLVSHLAWKFSNSEDVLKLDWNEATCAPSPEVIKALENHIKQGRINWYPDVDNLILKKSLSKYVGLPAENIQYYASSDDLHEYIVRAFLEPEDRVMIVAPTYDNFRASAESLGGLVEYFYLNEDFNLDFEMLCAELKVSCPKMLYICNPNNPTGTLISIEKLECLIREFSSILFILDEAYYEFAKITGSNLVKNYENLIITRTFSKAFAMASLRIGYLISSESNVKILDLIRNPKSINSFSQVAAIAALESFDYTKSYVEQVIRARSWFVSQINKIGSGKIISYESGGNFSLIKTDQSLKINLIKHLENDKIFVRNYSHVKGMENFLRITVGTQAQMERVLNSTIKFLNTI